LGATTVMMMMLKAGDHVVASDDVYGGMLCRKGLLYQIEFFLPVIAIRHFKILVDSKTMKNW